MDWPAFVLKNPEIDLPFTGVRGWLIAGEKQQVVFLQFDRDTEVPEHAHQDQWEFVLAGRADLHRAGGTETYAPGENFFVPAGQPHAATVHAGYRAMIVFDAPDRYRPKEGG